MIAGIEIGADSVRMAGLRRTRRRARPDVWAEAPLAPGAAAERDTGALAAATAAALKSAGWTGRLAALAPPPEWVLYREARFPHRSATRAMKALGFAVENRLPGPLGGYVVEALHLPRPSGQKGSRVLAAACEEQRLAAALEAMEKAGLDARVAQPSAAGLARYALAAAGPARVLVIRLDKAALDLALAERGEAQAAVSARLAGLDAGREQDAAEVCRRVAALARTLSLCGGHDMGGRALLLAAQTSGQALAERLEAELGLKIERSHEPGVEKWAAAWGAAANAAEQGRAAASLRQGALACPAYAQSTTRRVAAALVVAVALMALAVAQTWRASARWADQARDLEKQAAAAFVRATGWKNVRPSVQALRSELAKARAARAGLSAAPSCLVRWIDLMKLAPPGCGVEFQSISISGEGISLSMRAPNPQAVWDFQDRARKSGLFLPDAPVDARRPDRGEASYKMDLRYKP